MSSNKTESSDDAVQKKRGPKSRHRGQFRPGEFMTKERPAGNCEGPGCSNIVPGGPVPIRQKRYFCSAKCDSRYHSLNNQTPQGPCSHCGEEVRGPRHRTKEGQVFCSRDHMYLQYADESFGKDNPFRALVEEYIRVNSYYRESSRRGAKCSLAHFFRFAFQVEGLTELEEIRPSVVSRFIAHERDRGLTSGNFIGHISAFFGWLLAEERMDMSNPVIQRIHSQRGAPTQARPYKDGDLSFIWAIVGSCDDVALKLAFLIGKECGLRVGEVCNIRLEDIDRDKQEIFVRLPTKNMRTRRVPFHDGVAKYLDIWLAQRNPKCLHDHLLHSRPLAAFNTGSMSCHFKKLLRDRPTPAAGFHFHRLRHTWATRLMNGGMELAVLKVLGGWESWNSMQKYIKVLDSTIKRQYEESYNKLQQNNQAEDEETLSLLDFALMDSGEAATSTAAIV
jgi:integrase